MMISDGIFLEGFNIFYSKSIWNTYGSIKQPVKLSLP